MLRTYRRLSTDVRIYPPHSKQLGGELGRHRKNYEKNATPCELRCLDEFAADAA